MKTRKTTKRNCCDQVRYVWLKQVDEAETGKIHNKMIFWTTKVISKLL